MTRSTVFAALMLVAGASLAGGQQAPVPTPPKTVHPLPQPTTACRGCSDKSDSTKPSVGKYDEKKSGTIRSSVRPDAKVARQKVATKRKARIHGKRKVTAPKSASNAISKTVSKAKPLLRIKDRHAIGDPVMAPKKDTTKE